MKHVPSIYCKALVQVNVLFVGENIAHITNTANNHVNYSYHLVCFHHRCTNFVVNEMSAKCM